ncbi:hypothetical protein DFH09DRAFT_942402, partial [Mycena vulgaris]
RNVLVITGWNIHKDSITELGAKRFIQDTGQELHEFYSVDRLSPKAVDSSKWKCCKLLGLHARENCPSVTGVYRGQLLSLYILWNKGRVEPEHFHPSIQ